MCLAFRVFMVLSSTNQNRLVRLRHRFYDVCQLAPLIRPASYRHVHIRQNVYLKYHCKGFLDPIYVMLLVLLLDVVSSVLFIYQPRNYSECYLFVRGEQSVRILTSRRSARHGFLSKRSKRYDSWNDFIELRMWVNKGVWDFAPKTFK